MSGKWPRLNYDQWSASCDTLHAYTQVLGKLAAALAPPQPQLQHTALRLTARGWETLPLPAPDGSGALVVALDLHAHEALVAHSDGRSRPVALVPDRSGKVFPEAARWDKRLGEYVLDWDDVVASPDPHQSALEFARWALRHSCTVCEWDPALPASALGNPQPIR